MLCSRIRKNYKHTIYACYIGYITQAIVNNFTPLLFLTFVKEYKLTLGDITWITTLNFMVQLAVDLVSAKLLDKIGHRVSMMLAHGFAALGLGGLAVFPELFGDAYLGIITAVVIYAIGGGILEVLVSPIVEACPSNEKAGAMSLLHSFYCWGQVGVVLLSTVFFMVMGIENWKVAACFWAIIPFFNIIYFSMVPIYSVTGELDQLPLGNLIQKKVFWLLVVLMVCAGASELAMSQWASTFAESALQVEKAVGDLAGPCMFAACMGTARTIYGKCSARIPLRKALAGCGILCIISYVIVLLSDNALLSLAGCSLCGFSVGVFWPGTFSMAAQRIPAGGTTMYALLALAGDLGCSTGPAMVGMVAEQTGGNLRTGLGCVIVFPVVMVLGMLLSRKENVSG